ncbi:Indole-3-glycerol phosphate synthase [hydrothermal vent metagenome]|uniref:indole-3-glycerol-phosphate synthase n=1 Tax=hydrothermal vent metagenome TaxID=652676 RepID=A0A1W1BYR6_9ZZZZ
MQKIPDILEKIISKKFIEIKEDKKNQSLEVIQQLAFSNKNTRGFVKKLQQKINNKENAIIAEIKKASPSKGILREDFNVAKIAKSYQKAGATCLSILTDMDFFQGHNDFIQQARNSVDLPILRKDFIVDEYQIYQARTIGADCILLIASILTYEQMSNFCAIANSLNLDVLVEVHNLEELKKILPLNLPIIGINNRNLRNFEVDLETTFELSTHIPKETIIITESGIFTKEDIQQMNKKQIFSFLIGEAFMRADNPGKLLEEIL